MEENTHRIRIESAYGVPGQMSWAYNVIDESTGSIILEGEVEQKGEKTYHMLLRPTEGGREELGDVMDPFVADKRLLATLKVRAVTLLAFKE